ncbi:MAG: carboxypeptidase regulatory-like domain-containing protein, partial [Prevotella sp.]
DYWYVDDIKIWNPVWTQATLEVTSADGPVANCPVQLTSDSGAEINATTDTNGKISLPQIEEGSYTVSIEKDGYNIYGKQWDVTSSGSNTFTANLTRPIAVLSTLSVNSDMPTETYLTKEFTLSNSGDGTMSWYLDQSSTLAQGDTSDIWRIQKTFKASGDLQNAVGFDGANYYTTSSVTLGEFWKYDKEGNFIEKFSIPGMYYKLYDITYDGRYFYGSDYSNRLFKLDFVNRRVVDIINIEDNTGLSITHCSYDPDLDGFWFGSWNTLGFIKKDGTIVQQPAYFDTSRSLSVYGSAYDNVSEGGPYLWLADEETANDNALDCIQILQYSLKTKSLTNVVHITDDVPGYKIGDASMGRNYICGITTSTDVKDGTLSLIGVLQQSPSLIFSYKLCETDKWLGFQPRRGILEAGEQQTITVNFDSRYARLGDSFTAGVTLKTVPELTEQNVSFTLNATSETDVPRPIDVSATPGNASVTLTWQPGSSSKLPSGYDVYRNNVKVNDNPVTECSYTDNRLVYGEYTYKVKALYSGGKESLESDSVTALVKQGAPYYAPLRLTTSVELNRNVSLSWESPLADADKDDVISWSTGEHVDQIGLYEGGYFYAASIWEPTDLTAYRNKTIGSVSVQLVNQCTFLALRILKDG